MIIIIFGVAGAGKSLIGSLLAAELGWKFYDADLFHSPEHIEKMKQGVALTDEDRVPWLERLCLLLRDVASRGEHAVLACSALKESYRLHLTGCAQGEVRLVFLKGDRALIGKRLRKRRGHFIDPKLLESQFETLEEPHDGTLVVDAKLTPREIVKSIRGTLMV